MTPVESLRRAVRSGLRGPKDVDALLAAIDCAEREKHMGHDAARAYCAALARLEETK